MLVFPSHKYPSSRIINPWQRLFFYFIYIFFAVLFSSPNTPIHIFFLFLAIGFTIAIFDDYFTFVLLGASNFLPTLGPVSPMVVFIFLLLVKLLFKPRVFLNNRYIFILLFLISWLLLSSVMQGFDTIFLSSFLKGVIVFFLVYEYCLINDLDIKNGANSFVVGVSTGVVIGIFSLIKIFGYSSYNLYRLTLARGDSNSLGLSYNFIVVYLLAYLILEIKQRRTYKSMFLLLLISIVTFLLMLTGSRGSLFSAILSGIFCLILASIYRFPGQAIPSISKMIILGTGFIMVSLLFVMIYMYYPLINDLTGGMLDFVKDRLFVFEDTARENLYSSAFLGALNKPLFGIGLEKFFISSSGMLVHNSYLEYLISGGVIALTSVILMLILTWGKFLKDLYNYHTIYTIPLFLGFFAISLNYFTYSAIGDKLFWIPLGLLVSLNLQTKKVLQ